MLLSFLRIATEPNSNQCSLSTPPGNTENLWLPDVYRGSQEGTYNISMDHAIYRHLSTSCHVATSASTVIRVQFVDAAVGWSVAEYP